MSASNYLENELLDHALGEGGRNYTSPTLHVALFAGNVSDVSAALEEGSNATTAGNWGRYEINTGSYARQGINFATASGGSASSNSTVTFPQATANYNNTNSDGSTVTYVALTDASSGGNVIFYGNLTNPKEILSADTMSIASGSLTVSLA